MVNEPTSSWHPALMPNSVADIVTQAPKAVDSTIHSSTNVEKYEPADGWPDQIDEDITDAWLISEGTEPTEPIEVSQPTQPSPPIEVQNEFSQPHIVAHEASTGQDSPENVWLTNGDEIEGGAWLSQEEAAHEPSVKDPEPTAERSQILSYDESVEKQVAGEFTEPEVKEENAAEVKTEAPHPSIAQHSSSMSFARTVSHEISFADDDDGEYGLGRADNDAFSFMPLSDRTNSFPAVPPMTSESETHDDLLLPSNQALNVMEEDEKEAEIEEEEYLMRSPEGDSSASWQGHGVVRPHHAASRSIGGEIEEATATAEEARFEEGLPLIPHSDTAAVEEAAEKRVESKIDPFGEEDGNEDDFFGGCQTIGAPNDHESGVKPLERKSTFQVMEAMGDGGSLTRKSTVNETIEEHADEAAEGVALGLSEDDKTVPATEDLASKWEQAFGEDDNDDFLLDDSTAEDKDIDATAFLGSDDEGLLDDDVDGPDSTAVAAQLRQSAPNPHTPASMIPQQTASYMPDVSGHGAGTGQTYGYGQQPPAQFGQTPQPLRPGPAKTQSFADKSKDGYSSPYDLPTDLVKTVKPRKRSSLQQLPVETSPTHPGNANMYSSGQAPPSTFKPSNSSAPPVSGSQQSPPPSQKTATPALRSKGSFFEELPMSSKPRPASRQSQRAQSPGQYIPTGPPQQAPPPPMSHTVPPPPASQVVPPPASHTAPPPVTVASQAPPSAAQQPSEETRTPPGITNLVAPPRSNPYATLQSQPATTTPLSGNSSRYSPVPPGQQGGGVPISSRYSPASSAGSRPNSSYGAGPPHNILPHLPRTSSPLAHFETSGAADGQPYDRRASSSFEPRLNRVSSLPPTREVDEEEDEEEQTLSPGSRSLSASHAIPPTPKHTESRYSPAAPDAAARNTSPLPSVGSAPVATLSPSKSTNFNYNPQTPAPAHMPFAQPPRAQTLSPSAMHTDGKKGSRTVEYVPQPQPQPSTSHPPLIPGMTKLAQTTQPAHAPTSRTRGQSLTNMIPPTDGRENDPLGRWRGAPIMAWGVGGLFVTSFPKSIPRYAMGQTTPVTIRAVGEVKVQNIKDLDPLQDRLSKFPGPLKGKSRKKEAVAWLSAGIEALEKEIPDVSFHSQLSLEAKRSVERLLLWKLLRVFIEHDGVLEGTPAVEKAVREVLAPEIVSEGAPLFTATEATGSASSSMKADGVDWSAAEKIRLDLLKGDRETAVWAAVDKRLWGHAMIISQTVSPELYKQVAQEFVRKEVNYPGHNNESLAALYKILSGNYDDCVDELVPSHARAGLQLVSTETSSGPTKDAMDGLDKWRETLTLVLSNRSSDDIRGLNALGKLLSSYGRAEAAHICFIFSRSLSVFGGLDDYNSDFVLVGSDHRQQSNQFAKETEALQLSEIYEYGLTLGSGVAAAAGAPHLAAYKLQHAVTLAEYGFRDKALQYCDAIASAIIAQTRRSPYHHPILEASVEDFLTRLKQTPKEAGSSWISKPTMGKVSDSMWNRFNKFVSGDEDGNGNAGSDGDNGPFARIASSPNISRPPSTSNFDMYGSSPGYQPTAGAPIVGGHTASRYAPAPTASYPNANASASPHSLTASAQYTAASATARTSQEYTGYNEPSYPGGTAVSAQPSGYQPAGYLDPAAVSAYHTVEAAAPGHMEPAPMSTSSPHASSSGYQPYGLQESPDIHPQQTDANQGGYQPSPYGYEPPQVGSAPTIAHSQQEGGSSGYEPPSLQPATDEDDAIKPKKKSFMDDDDDDIPALRKPQDRSKSDKDRENEEMFRKAAEEDAKRAAAAAGAKKGWGFGGWFGGGKKGDGNIGEPTPGKPIKAKLGEQSSFFYDPDLGRWVNKKPGAENVEAKRATPPPPRGMTRSVSGTPPPVAGRSSVPPTGLPPRSNPGNLSTAQSMDNLTSGAPPAGMPRSVSSSGFGSGPPSTGPPSRPATSMSNASSIDDLLGAPAPRKAGQKKARKSGRYVDVMAK
ncbi:vesicle coat component [Conoideocrella luteorostrata]|uniref:Protein transport protein sec16 n=1 Tax=Conoideocrella luteorostrata TaxID=1105319 RepID=A0AAJ0CL57_9HYPO|nr:vesicle coat component [Conoideocrella luteorostrata]